LRQIMKREFRAVHAIHKRKGIDMRTAAYVHALERIHEAVAAHGTRGYFARG
jgi:glutamate dehydrogenase (NADP+)